MNDQLPGFEVAESSAPKSEPPFAFDADALRRRFVEVLPYPDPQRWRVAGGRSRAGQVGLAVANINLKHSSGFEVVLLFDDGKLDSFSSISLFPAPPDHE